MDRPLSVLLVEDDPTTCREMIACMAARDDMMLVGVTNNASKAIEQLCADAPDALILDLELHGGAGNGLSVLQEMEALAKPVRPYVLIATSNTSAITHDAARALGADFTISKHQADYTPQGVVELLAMMRTMIQGRTQSARPGAAVQAPDSHSKQVQRRIAAELELIGVSPKAVGYRYLVSAIERVMDGPVQNLCTLLGKQYGKTEASVERAMQNAINRAWSVTPLEELIVHYTAKIRSEKGVPTMMELIHYYASKLSLEG